jgi:hypothetical protein
LSGAATGPITPAHIGAKLSVMVSVVMGTKGKAGPSWACLVGEGTIILELSFHFCYVEWHETTI